MKHLLKEYFTFSKRERNGILLLTSIILILFLLPSFYTFFTPKIPPAPPFPKTIVDYQARIVEKQDLAYDMRQAAYQPQQNATTSSPLESEMTPTIEPFPFNPNELTVAQAQQLGLSKKVAHTIQNYRNKGGKFFKKEDLKKIYGLKEAEYDRLADYIVLPKSKQKAKKSFIASETKEQNDVYNITLFPFNPNSIDIEELKQLGLSKKVAQTWINFREKGGQFFKKEDIQKIYGLKDSDYNRLADYITIAPKAKKQKIKSKNKEVNSEIADIPTTSTPKPSTIQAFPFDPNTISFEELKQLGLSKKVAQTWMNFRDKGGQFFEKEEVKKIYGLTIGEYEQLANYINISPKIEKQEVTPKNKEVKSKIVDAPITKSESTPKPSIIQAFPFDPNTISFEELKQLGLSQKVAQTWINFRDKGGQFFKKEEVKKIYGLTISEYEQLANYINIPPKIEKQEVTPKNKEVKSEIVDAPITKSESTPKPSIIQAFPFDPNTISFKELKQLGLSKKVAQTWMNFRAKGGLFFKKEDVKKIYGLTEATYEQLSNSIRIENAPKSSISTAKNATIAVDMNQADEAEWRKIRGIGKTFSARIVKYRDLLGGFVHKEQLKEVYGLDEEKYNGILPALRLSPSKVQQINLNTATINDLKKHPYIDYNAAKAMVNLREQHGDFKEVAGIKASYAIDDALFQKIKLYLTVK